VRGIGEGDASTNAHHGDAQNADAAEDDKRAEKRH
jgi:hypothetical protein